MQYSALGLGWESLPRGTDLKVCFKFNCTQASSPISFQAVAGGVTVRARANLIVNVKDQA